MKNIPTQAENPKGLHQRYHIQKIVKNELHFMSHPKDKSPEYLLKQTDEGSEYFVMRLDKGGSDIEHIKACRIGVHAYAIAIQYHLPELAKNLRERYPLL